MLDAPDHVYGAVFYFGIIHHIPNWHDALDEIARVLRPGGRFYFDEVTAKALASRTHRLLFDHPTEDLYTAEQFFIELAQRNLHVGEHHITRRAGRHILGVAQLKPLNPQQSSRTPLV